MTGGRPLACSARPSTLGLGRLSRAPASLPRWRLTSSSSRVAGLRLAKLRRRYRPRRSPPARRIPGRCPYDDEDPSMVATQRRASYVTAARTIGDLVSRPLTGWRLYQAAPACGGEAALVQHLAVYALPTPSMCPGPSTLGQQRSRPQELLRLAAGTSISAGTEATCFSASWQLLVAISASTIS